MRHQVRPRPLGLMRLHRAALASADLFPRGRLWVRMRIREDHTRCAKQPPSIAGHEARARLTVHCHNLWSPRSQSRKRPRLRLTDSSFSNSGLHCAASSATGFWTMFLQTSQMVRLAMNMPTSGTNTRIPLPASAPFKLWREQKGGGNSVVLMLQWLNHHRVCMNTSPSMYVWITEYVRIFLRFKECSVSAWKVSESFSLTPVFHNLLRLMKISGSFRNSMKNPKPTLTPKMYWWTKLLLNMPCVQDRDRCL